MASSSPRPCVAKARPCSARDGERFTDELAPRDEVTLAVLDRMERDGADHVLLDLRAVSEARFPNVFEALREAGYDPASEPIPVSPASHYVMGGIATDLAGRSSVPGLFAVGECACTGLHGANRLASNSLTECFVLGARAAAAASAMRQRGLWLPVMLPASRPSLPPGASSHPRPRPERRSGAWPGPCAAPNSLERLLDDPYPLARLIARFALERARIPRLPPAPRVPRS